MAYAILLISPGRWLQAKTQQPIGVVSLVIIIHVNARTGPSSKWSRDTGVARVADRAKNWLQTVFVSIQVENRSSASLRVWHADSDTSCRRHVEGDAVVLSRCPPPRARNRLPSELKTTTCSIETFKRRLKTFYLILLLVLIRRDNVTRHHSV